eukprot:jgi/Chlat1/3419/Chrsp23S00275
MDPAVKLYTQDTAAKEATVKERKGCAAATKDLLKRAADVRGNRWPAVMRALEGMSDCGAHSRPIDAGFLHIAVRQGRERARVSPSEVSEEATRRADIYDGQYISVLKWLLLYLHADVNATPIRGLGGCDGQTALHVAADCDNAEAVDILLSIPNVRVDIRNFKFDPKDSVLANRLFDGIEREAELERRDIHKLWRSDTRYMPLHHAVSGRVQPRIVNALLAADGGQHANALTSHGNTALHLYLKQGTVDSAVTNDARSVYLDIVKMMVEVYGLSPNEANTMGETPVHFAATSGNAEVLKYLCSRLFTTSHQRVTLYGITLRRLKSVHPPSLDAMVDKQGCTPLHCAAQSGSAECVRYLLDECECDPTAVKTAEGVTVEQCLTGLAKRSWQYEFADREVFTSAIGGLLVVATLMASVTYQSFSNPPDAWIMDMDESNQAASVTRRRAVGAWVLGSTLSFYFALAVVVVGALTYFPWFKMDLSWKARANRRGNLVAVMAACLTASLLSAIVAFTASGYATLDNDRDGTLFSLFYYPSSICTAALVLFMVYVNLYFTRWFISATILQTVEVDVCSSNATGKHTCAKVHDQSTLTKPLLRDNSMDAVDDSDVEQVVN